MVATVLVTGATGLLGRAVLAAFTADADFSAVGTAFTRAAASNLLVLNLTDDAAIAAAIASVAPRIVIHCAAERRPDACEADAARAARINVHAVYALARAAEGSGADFFQISTDYLWDGTAAPYDESVPLSPLNAYGAQKARGEAAAIAGHARAVILRVPVLYGATTDLRESAVTAFAAVVREADNAATIDDWQIRVPTHTADVAATLLLLARAAVAEGGAATGQASRTAGVWHCSSSERFTRFGLVQLYGELLGLPINHVTRLQGEPPGAKRPYDCALTTLKLEAAGFAAPHRDFRTAVLEILRAA